MSDGIPIGAPEGYGVVVGSNNSAGSGGMSAQQQPSAVQHTAIPTRTSINSLPTKTLPLAISSPPIITSSAGNSPFINSTSGNSHSNTSIHTSTAVPIGSPTISAPQTTASVISPSPNVFAPSNLAHQNNVNVPLGVVAGIGMGLTVVFGLAVWMASKGFLGQRRRLISQNMLVRMRVVRGFADFLASLGFLLFAVTSMKGAFACLIALGLGMSFGVDTCYFGQMFTVLVLEAWDVDVRLALAIAVIIAVIPSLGLIATRKLYTKSDSVQGGGEWFSWRDKGTGLVFVYVWLTLLAVNCALSWCLSIPVMAAIVRIKGNTSRKPYILLRLLGINILLTLTVATAFLSVFFPDEHVVASIVLPVMAGLHLIGNGALASLLEPTLVLGGPPASSPPISEDAKNDDDEK